MDEDTIVFNGLNGATGAYLQPPTSLPALAASVLGADFRGDSVRELKYLVKQPHFGTVYGIDEEDLSESGWALVAATDAPQDVLDALSPLRRLRSRQAGDRYRECLGANGYQPGDTKRTFLARCGMGSALPANPERMPYYVLLIGDPESIPFSFQYQLDVQYAVGRIAFDTTEEYARYADSVVAGEEADLPRRMRLFGPRNAADQPTQLSADRLVAPLRDSLHQQSTWDVAAIPPEGCGKATLAELLRGTDAPLLFTAGHGLGFPSGHARQRDVQGALVCQDWPGPLLAGGEPAENAYFAGADVDQLPGVGTRIMMSFACFGAGTPVLDDFVTTPGQESVAVADFPFVARLPQRLLAHPDGGLLGFVGHVERAWSCSFVSHRVGPQHEVFLSALLALMNGWRLGHAIEFFNNRYAAATAELHEILDGVRTKGDAPDQRLIARLWLENNDARSYVVLGDPAVRLCVNRSSRNDGDE
jgi:hypothetical protein